MKHSIMPIIFYPTTVILVDDNTRFLEAMSSELAKAHIDTLTFNDPVAAIKYINDLPRNNPYIEGLHHDDNRYLSSTSKVAFDLKALTEKAREHKGKTVSLVISDYDMPTVRGDELFTMLDNCHIKKIMLTGEADQKTAIELLNSGLIDNFITKDFTGTPEHLKNAVLDYQLNYFCHLMASITDHLFPSNSIQASKAYNKLLKNIIEEHGITEYYTVSRNGNKLMTDRNGKQWWLATATEEDFDGWYETAELEDAPDDILNALKERRKILLLTDEADADVESSEWGAFMHNVQQVESNGEPLYYTVTAA